MLSPTPIERLVDQQGRPYFLWDSAFTLEQFRAALRDSETSARAYLIGKLMRQAKPDDVFSFVSPQTIRELWPSLERYLGETRAFWTWLLDQVSDGEETCVVDLMAEPVPALETPAMISTTAATIAVDTRHEILVSKLCALLGRSEIRDLQDVEALLEGGGDFDRALADSPQKDAGFSALTLAWVLKQLDLAALAGAAGVTPEEAERLADFRDRLTVRLLALANPEAT